MRLKRVRANLPTTESETNAMRFFFFFLVCCELLVWTTSFLGAESTRIENVPLYCFIETCDEDVVRYDGSRRASIARDATVIDRTDCNIKDVSQLREVLGKEPDLTSARPGDRAGDELGYAYYATLTLNDGKIVEITIERRLPRPLIGVSWTQDKRANDAQRVIAESILRLGGRVLFLQKANDDDCDDIMKELDGFVMPGGADVDPAYYGETTFPHGSLGIVKARDISDIAVSRYAIDNNLPALWICRGEQVLNVALGGALIQDVPTYLGERARRGEFSKDRIETIPDEGAPLVYGGKETTQPCDPPHYRVVIDGFAHRSGRHSLGTPDDPRISENSKFLLPIVGRRYFHSVVTSHHQAVDPERLGKGLTIVATTPDGVVEAIEYQSNDFALATQFHYERDAFNEDPEIARLHNSFFKALIDAAREKRATSL